MKILKELKVIKLKIYLILIIAIAAVILVIGNASTYSWFADSETVEVSATVATAEDFISVGEVVNEPPDSQGVIPAYIKIIKNCSEDITVSFEIQGEVAKYLAPIESITLRNKESIIPINVIATTNNYLALTSIYNKNKTDILLGGTISVKCFNEFVKETRELKMSVKYLMTKALRQIN